MVQVSILIHCPPPPPPSSSLPTHLHTPSFRTTEYSYLFDGDSPLSVVLELLAVWAADIDPKKASQAVQSLPLLLTQIYHSCTKTP